MFKNKWHSPDGGQEDLLEGLARLHHNSVAVHNLHHLASELPVLGGQKEKISYPPGVNIFILKALSHWHGPLPVSKRCKKAQQTSTRRNNNYRYRVWRKSLISTEKNSCARPWPSSPAPIKNFCLRLCSTLRYYLPVPVCRKIIGN